MRRRDALIALGAAALAPAATAEARPVPIGRWTRVPHGLDPAHPMPMEHGGASRNGRLLHRIPDHAPALAWEAGPPPSSAHRPARAWEPIVASDGTILFGTWSGLAAFASEGTPRFFSALGSLHASPVILPGGGYACVTTGGRAVRLARDGTIEEAVELGGPSVVSAPLVLDDGSLVIAGTDRTLRLLDGSLRERWRVPVGPAPLAPTRDGDRIAVVVQNEVAFFDLDGGEIGRVPLGARGMTPAARADDGTLWITAVDGHVVAVEGARRIVHRVRVIQGALDDEAPAIAPDATLRVAARQNGLVCIAPSGDVRWTAATEGALDFAVRVDPRGCTLGVARPQRLCAWDENGAPIWQVSLPSATRAGVAVLADGAIVAIAEQGRAMVLR
jgi:outer membrane protein assembly factor BamB